MFESQWRIATIGAEELSIFDRDSEPRIVEALSTDSPVRVKVPQFQRSLVWGKKKREDFFDSLRKGYPFGIVTLADIGSSEGQRQFRLIDGLQRMTALRSFVTNFLAWYKPTEDDLLELVQAAEHLGGAISGDDARQFFEQWLASRNEADKPFDAMNLIIDLAGHVSSTIQITEVTAATGLASAITSRIQGQRSQLLGVSIPVQVIGATLQQNLAEVFDKLNSNLQLSKYDLLAATLDTIVVDLTTLGVSVAERRDLVQFANRRFDLAKEEGYDVELYEEDEERVTLFDYLYARSRWASREYATLSAKESELAFNVAALVFGRSMRVLDGSAATHISDAVPRADGDPDVADVAAFDEAFRAATKAVHESLDLYVGWDLKKTNLVNPLGILQAATYVSSFIALVYRVEGGGLRARTNSAADTALGDGSMTATQRRQAFRSNLQWWLLLDSLGRTFIGSDAYENTVRRTWRSTDPAALEPGEVLLTRPSLDLYLLPLHDLFTLGLEVPKTPERRVALSGPASALMRFAFAARQGSIADSTIDHIFPIKWGATGPDDGEALALNHFGNIAFVGSADNSGRQHKLLPEWLGTLGDDQRADTVERLQPLVLMDLETLTEGRAKTHLLFSSFLQDRARLIAIEAFKSMDAAYYAAHQSEIDALVEQAMSPAIQFSSPEE